MRYDQDMTALKKIHTTKTNDFETVFIEREFDVSKKNDLYQFPK